MGCFVPLTRYRRAEEATHQRGLEQILGTKGVLDKVLVTTDVSLFATMFRTHSRIDNGEINCLLSLSLLLPIVVSHCTMPEEMT